MSPILFHRPLATPCRLLIGAALTLVLAACGGGGGDPGTPGTTPTAPGTTPVALPKITVSMVNGSGVAITTLSGGQKGVVRVALVDAKGAIVANEVVKFSADDSLILFDPASGSALTDAAGVAVINVTPANVSAAGATAITATAVVAGKTAMGTVNIAVGAAPLTVGTLTFNPAPTGKIPAFSTAVLHIPIASGGQAATSVTGLNLSSLCIGDGAATLVPGALTNGVQSATYTNNGCLRGTDVITVSIGNSSQTITIGVDSANIGTIQFVGSDLAGSSIVLKGSGGLGRKESALLTFRVLDQNNVGLGGVDVMFRATTNTGGLTVQPANGTTDTTGLVTTTVSSGTIPTPVRVVAEATRNGKTISGLSDTLTVSTGLPIQKAMSLSASSYNIEGLSFDGETTSLTVRLADQYGNPISDDTAVNFVTEGGAVGTSARGACTTVNGGCTVTLITQQFKPVNGRVTVLAYAQGVENFVDANGDGNYSCSSAPASYRPLVDACASGGEPFTDQGDPFLDTGKHDVTWGVPASAALNNTLDGVYDFAKGDLPIPYNRSVYSVGGNNAWGINYVWRAAEIVFSGSDPTLVRQFCTAGVCRDWQSASDGDSSLLVGLHGAGCASRDLHFRIYDVNNNPLPHETAVQSVDALAVAPQTMFPDKVGSTADIGGTFHSVSVLPSELCSAGGFTVKITTPNGVVKPFRFNSAPLP